MSAGRLTFLYPPLLRAAAGAGAPRHGSAAATRFIRSKSLVVGRHGKAVEPLPVQKSADAASPPTSLSEGVAKADQAAAAAGPPATDKTTVSAAQGAGSRQGPEAAQATDVGVDKRKDKGLDKDKGKGKDKQAAGEEKTRHTRDEAKQSGPLEAVLHMPSPEHVAKQHPSMSPPPYVHHFDSYSLVKQLQDGGYTEAQATMAMKGIRGALAQNLDVAQASLVSKSDVENETYLFRAACSELSTEIKNNRRLQDEQVRQQRTHLQHEVDILTQSLSQELLTLNDNVRGMFNDRKMAVREEQKTMESAVQQINYKISISLTSDAKSEIEGVRWILIRRSVLGILFMAVLTLGTLRYATYVSHKRQREAERKKKEEDQRRRDGGKRDHSSAPDAAVILAAN